MADPLVFHYKDLSNTIKLTWAQMNQNLRSIEDGVIIVQDAEFNTTQLENSTSLLRDQAQNAATLAANEAGVAADAATLASNKASAASGSATTATDKASAASQSEINAAQSAADANQSATDAAQSATDAQIQAESIETAVEPAPNRIPLARSDAKIHGGWVDGSQLSGIPINAVDLPPLTTVGAALISNESGDGLVFTEQSLDSIIDSKIYKAGISSSQAVGVALIEVGGNGGTFVHINEYNQVIDVTTGQFNKHEIWGQIKDVVIDGQDMVRIPKFYIKTVWTYIAGYEGLKRIRLISLERGAGFRVHPAFMKNGAEIDQIYVGKYQASLEDGRLASLPGVLPAVERSLTQFTNDALARNVEGVDGFMLWSIYQLSAIQMLFMVEHKTMDSQAAVGQGRVATSSAAEVDAEDVAQASYRGIVGLWGNVWQWCQGIRAVNGAISVWDTDGNQTFVDTPHKRAEDVAEIIYPVDFFDESGDGYDLGDLFVGKTGPTSNSGATAPDYNRLRLAGTFFCSLGGNWSNGSNAGLWALTVSASAAYVFASLGARLAKS